MKKKKPFPGKKSDGARRAFCSVNPVTGLSVWSGRAASADEVGKTMTSARTAFASWRNMTLEARYSLLEKFTDLVSLRQEEIAKTISDETGKVLWDAKTEVAAVVKKAAISLKAYHQRTPTQMSSGKPQIILTHKPHGVMAVFGPFNFPVHLPHGHIAPALLAGNTIVFKPSPLAARSGQLLVKLYEQAGIPKGVINLVQGGSDVGHQILTSRHLDGVLFTGGLNAGKAIARVLADRLGVVVALELGGNNPLVIWSVENIAAAAKTALVSAYISAGQRCTCARRLIVHEGREGKKIINSLVEATKKISIGFPDAEPQPFMGPLISSDAVAKVLKRQSLLEQSGGNVLLRGQRLKLGKAFLSPALIDVTKSKYRLDEECFGPLLQIVRVKNFEAAIAEANNTAYGLAAGILTDKENFRDHFFSEIEAGIVNWNQMLPGASSEAPFGGIKMSGNHRPSSFYAADYSAWPMASLENPGKLRLPVLPHGIKM